MKISYTGRQVELAPAQLRKLEARFAKIGKLLDGRRESECHVILSAERHLHCSEATVNYFGHQLVGIGSSADLFTAIHSAAEKLEKQALKSREKWRDTRRVPRKTAAPAAPAGRKAAPELPEEPEAAAEASVKRVSPPRRRKPMTLDEAVLEMEKKQDYLVYRDAATDRVSVLIRRPGGGFDLVEG
jgi:putative sigma-54 modulation protein